MVRLSGEQLIRRTARTIWPGGRYGLLAGAVAVLAVLGTLAGVLAAVFSGGGAGPAARAVSGAAVSASPASGTGVPAVRLAGAKQPPVAPLGQSVRADLLVVAPSSLPGRLLTAVDRLPGLVAAERIEAFRTQVNGTDTAVVGVDPSRFRSFAARLTGASSALWQRTRSPSAARYSRPGARAGGCRWWRSVRWASAA